MGEQHPRPPETWRDEPIIALIAVCSIFAISMFVGVAVLVGEMNIAPLNAAGLMIFPSIVLGVIGAQNRWIRRLASGLGFLDYRR